MIQSELPEEDDGIWHVTTAVSAVLEQGVLPRSRTGAIGLGGGICNDAPHLVSTVPRHLDAVRLYRAMRFMVPVATGEISTADAVRAVVEFNDSSISVVESWQSQNVGYYDEDDDSEEALPYDSLGETMAHRMGLRGSLWDIDLRDSWVRERLDSRFQTGKQRYELIQGLEQDINEVLMDYPEELPPGADVVGFTAPWSRFVKIEPREIGIVRLAARRGAATDIQASENELRFRPEDLFIIGVEIPHITPK